MFGQVPGAIDMLKWSKSCWNFTPSVTNQTHGRIIAKAWNNTAMVMTWPVKYYTHVGVNQSMVILHVVVNVQHTFANQFLVMFEVLTNSKSGSNDMRQEWPTQNVPKTNPKIGVIPGAYIMEIYTNTTRPTPGHDKANILPMHGGNIIVVNATMDMTISWPNNDHQIEVGQPCDMLQICPVYAPWPGSFGATF